MWSSFFLDKNRFFRSASWLLIFLFLSEATPATREQSEKSFYDQPQLPADSLHAGSFSVITYNIAGLPQVICSAVTPRKESISTIGRLLNRFDIAHVQEDFNYNQYLYNGGNNHPFRTPTEGAVMTGDGLNTLSKFPVKDLRRIPWTDCTGADCFTPKGFTYTRIEIATGRFIDFYNVHANAYNHPRAALARRHNMEQLSAYIRLHSTGNAVIVMGDLNGRYSFGLDNVDWLLKENGLSDAWVRLYCDDIVPKRKDGLPPNDILSITDSTETIDKILFRSSASIKLEPFDYVLEKELFCTGNGLPLSDHHPVSARFNWILIEPTITFNP